MPKIYIIPLVLGTLHFAYLCLAFIRSGRKEKKGAGENACSVEHVVCFKNESAFIEKKLKNCYEIDHPRIHHTFVDDHSSDDTLMLLERHGQGETDIISNETNLGKNRSQMKSASRTDADLLLFTDANVFLRKDALTRLVGHFDRDTGGICGNVTTTTDMENQDIVGRYWEIEKHVKAFQSLSGSVIGFDGGFYCVKRENYNLRRKNELSDFETAFLILEQGKKTGYARDALAVEREKRKITDSFKARIRASNRVFWSYGRIFRYVHRLSPAQIGHFAFHKLIRYLFIISSVLVLPFIVRDLFRLSPFLLLLFLVPYVFRPILEGLALCIGGLVALAGKEYRTWSNRKA